MSLASQSLKVTALAEVVWILAMQVHSPFILKCFAHVPGT